MDLFSGMCSDCSAKASERFFEVNNYGYSRKLEKDFLTRRPAGRPDYQLIYVKSGTMTVYAGRIAFPVPAGSAMLYRPWEPQLYRYASGETAAYYWFHFSGTGCEEVLDGLFDGARVMSFPNGYEFDEALADLRTHALGDDPLSKEYAAARVMLLLALCKRQGGNRDRAVERVIMQIRREKFGEGSNAAYAALAGMSEAQFLRRFAAYTGTTPHKYKSRLLLRQAAELLQDTEMNIGEVSYALGIDDSLYFSRLFKKEYGVAPSRYQTLQSTVHGKAERK